jgi:protein involved in sex pheromone biosynthesis
MKQLFVIAVMAVSILLASCDGTTSSDRNMVDSTSGDSMNRHTDSSMPKDTVYPKTDTNSYRKDTTEQPPK